LIRPHTGEVPQLRVSQLQGDAALYGALQAAIGVVLDTAGRSDFNAEGMLGALTEAADVAG
jgi:hypothetical protein